jgi:hypothetical protein
VEGIAPLIDVPKIYMAFAQQNATAMLFGSLVKQFQLMDHAYMFDVSGVCVARV